MIEVLEFAKLKNCLESTIGSNELKEMTEDIVQILRKHNLDVTPVILNDYLVYLKQTISLSKI